MSDFFKKLYYYRDLGFLLHISRISTKIIFAKPANRLKILEINPTKKYYKLKKNNQKKIAKYTTLYLFLLKKIGISSNCLHHSLLLCRLFREAGLDAKINFGTQKAKKPTPDDWATIGHCWVSLAGEKISSDFPFIFQYP